MSSEARRRADPWAQPPRRPRRREPLTREEIVAAAVAIADGEGLEAVSMRRVAAALGAGTMSLYSHVERKEDLLELMVDELAGELLVPGPIPDDWRAALRTIAMRSYRTVMAHPWFIDAAGPGTGIGPNMLRHFDQSLAAVASLDVDRETSMTILAAVDDYAAGHAYRRLVLGEWGQDDGDVLPHVERMLADGELSHIARFMGDGALEPLNTFERGLDWLLDGIAAALRRRDHKYDKRLRPAAN